MKIFKKFYSLLFLSLLILSSINIYSQNKDELINPDNFDPLFLNSLILSNINDYRLQQGFEALTINPILAKAADDQAFYMAWKQEETLENKKGKKTTSERVMLYGGTNQVTELVEKTYVRRGREPYTYKYVAKEISDTWIDRKKTEEVVAEQKYILAGLGSFIDIEKKKVYVSLVLGNHKSFNTGAKKRDMLEVPFSKRKYWLKPYDDKTCRRCERIENIERFQKGLFVKDGKIYFKCSRADYRDFRRLIRNKKNGIAVDIVQKLQYSCEMEDNIVDYNNLNKGVMLKPMYSKKIYRKNLIKGKRVREFYFELGNFPESIDGKYELNLLIIQDKHVCKTITQTYIQEGKSNFLNPLSLVPDTISIDVNSLYYPVPDTTWLTFRIPFDKNKFEYNPEDMQPFLEALNEPEFFIQRLTIIAVSSIEGSVKRNKELQEKRAKSIVEALEKRQKSSIVSDVSTNNSWGLFRADVMDSKYSKIANMSMEEAKEYISRKGMWNELEPILEKHRFADIDMEVVYDITGENEQAFVVDKFNKTIKQEDIPFAFGIQKFILNQVVQGIYNADAVKNMKIPDKDYLGPFHINKMFLEQITTENKLKPSYREKINTLHKYAPNNVYIYFNKMCCDVYFGKIVKNSEIRETQSIIKKFYETDIPKEYIDDLDLNFQFRIIKLCDTLDEPNKTVLAAFEKVKELVKIDDTDCKNALELAKLFINYEDYRFAGKILDKYIDKPKVNKDFIFTYIAICSHSQARIMSNKFYRALNHAAAIDKKRYCELFNGNKFSFQIFDNPFVKQTYCKTCYMKK
ncbi:MAG: CAP domain-containing protein [Bacteroidota bacterium]|nr:CAP domain-containing protein [Bacteroidota bacterium]